jgi:hypothetical protein
VLSSMEHRRALLGVQLVEVIRKGSQRIGKHRRREAGCRFVRNAGGGPCSNANPKRQFNEVVV